MICNSPIARLIGKMLKGLPLLALMVAYGAAAEKHKDIAALPQTKNEIGPRPAYEALATDYVRQDAMIKMRDGKKLKTIVIRPKTASEALPIIMFRTPYDAEGMLDGSDGSSSLVSMLYDGEAELAQSGYIFVFQDIRGRNGSEGDFILNRPLRGPLNNTATDESTDAYDTIDWLVKNVPNNNGRVGVTGTSYDGFTTLMALVDPHPALKAAVPVNPMVDGWIGDDWFHNGAFRIGANADWIYAMTLEGDKGIPLPWAARDTYTAILEAGSSADFGRKHQLDKSPFWQRLLANPTYNNHWRQQAVDRELAARAGTAVATLMVHSLFDEEDIYGSIAAYRALERNDTKNDRIFLVAGPWNHGGSGYESANFGKLRWGSSTGRYFQKEMYRPFFDKYLKDIELPSPIAPVTAFDTGSHRWQSLAKWPDVADTQAKSIYLAGNGVLTFDRPVSAAQASYTADPARPTPFRTRPILAPQTKGSTWNDWLADDQRPFSNRPDVVTFVSPPLDRALVIRGTVKSRLFVTTDATDADYVVKLIDVFPEALPTDVELAGHQMMVSGDIMRARYREEKDKPAPLMPGKPNEIVFNLPEVSHTFLKGHRIMVQVQSYWFPLYDRNPQKFVPNIFEAKIDDYRAATHNILIGADHASLLELPVAK